MAYNLGTVRENVRNRLDDEDFEQEYLDRAINYAQWEITNKHHLTFLEKTDTLSISTSDTEVSLPADFHEFLYLRIATPTALRADLTQLYQNYEDFVNVYLTTSLNTPVQPYIWSMFGRKVKFAAPADQNYTFTLDYLRSSPKLTLETDVPDIPEEYQELLELGAYMRIAKREDDYDVKSQEEKDYRELLTSLLRVYGRAKQPGGFRRMRAP